MNGPEEEMDLSIKKEGKAEMTEKRIQTLTAPVDSVTERAR